MLLGETSLHVRGPMGKVLLAAAAYLVALAMLSRGPLGLVHMLGPRRHQALDLVLVVGLAASPVIVLLVRPGSDLDTAGIIVAEALAIVLLRLAFRTCYVRTPVPAPAGSGYAPPVEVELTALATAGGGDGPADRGASGAAEGGDEAPPEEAEPQTAHEEKRPVPSTAWTLGVLAARARRRGTGSDRILGAGARRLGTALGRANRRRSD